MKFENFPFNIINLSHLITTNCPTWEGKCGFFHEVVVDYKDFDTAVKFRVQKFKLNAGIGTHMDAPAHCFEGEKTVDQFSLEDLFFPCAIIDVSKKAQVGYQVTVGDIQYFEQTYGKIVSQTFVIIYTGWDRFWQAPEKYRASMRFPSISKQAAEYLLTQNIAGLGIDTLSPDTPDSEYPVHEIVLGAGKIIVENVANAHLLPPSGSFVLVAPMLIEHATEAPVRLIGFVKNK